MEKEGYIKNNWCEMWINDDILYITYFPNIIIDLPAAKKILTDRLTISKGKEYLVHGDCRGVKYWTRDSREFQSKKENFYLAKAGTVVYYDFYALNIIANFYLKFNKQWIPLKFCSSEQEALDWLERFRKR